MDWIELVASIDLPRAWQFLHDAKIGAHGYFLGAVRDTNLAVKQEVLYLEFEAYEAMALAELRSIVSELRNDFAIQKTLALHALGRKYPGEPVVFLGVSALRRRDALEACAKFIDLLKQRVPIWKKEYFRDGSHWVQNHP